MQQVLKLILTLPRLRLSRYNVYEMSLFIPDFECQQLYFLLLFKSDTDFFILNYTLPWERPVRLQQKGG